MTKKIKTISLKGKAYAQVKDRVTAFHEDNKNGQLHTSYEFKEGFTIFKATVTPDIEQARSFTGHAFGKIGSDKAFEKLETVAVGRALALAGYLADGEIASFDEMQEFEHEKPNY